MRSFSRPIPASARRRRQTDPPKPDAMKINNDAPGELTAPGEIRIMRTLPGPIERLWQYLTDPEKGSRWFAGGPMELKVGGKLELFFHGKKIAPDEVPPAQFAD